jgi:hypothetical protein
MMYLHICSFIFPIYIIFALFALSFIQTGGSSARSDRSSHLDQQNEEHEQSQYHRTQQLHQKEYDEPIINNRPARPTLQLQLADTTASPSDVALLSISEQLLLEQQRQLNLQFEILERRKAAVSTSTPLYSTPSLISGQPHDSTLIPLQSTLNVSLHPGSVSRYASNTEVGKLQDTSTFNPDDDSMSYPSTSAIPQSSDLSQHFDNSDAKQRAGANTNSINSNGVRLNSVVSSSKKSKQISNFPETPQPALQLNTRMQLPIASSFSLPLSSVHSTPVSILSAAQQAILSSSKQPASHSTLPAHYVGNGSVNADRQLVRQSDNVSQHVAQVNETLHLSNMDTIMRNHEWETANNEAQIRREFQEVFIQRERALKQQLVNERKKDEELLRKSLSEEATTRLAELRTVLEHEKQFHLLEVRKELLEQQSNVYIKLKQEVKDAREAEIKLLKLDFENQANEKYQYEMEQFERMRRYVKNQSKSCFLSLHSSYLCVLC